MLLPFTLASAAVDPRCSSISTDDLIACVEAERRRADAELNAVYGAALKGESGAAARRANGGLSWSQALVASERAWIAYRDAQCRVETYGNWDGHELPIYQRGCLTALTKARTKQLKELVAPK